jgi:Cu2+-exporting ATPase
LRASGCGIEILSGDSHARVAAIAGRLGIDRFGSRVHPEQKLARLAQLRAEGMNVAVIGDGVNDAPALAGADLAVAVGGGAELAKSSADIVLAGDRLGGLIEARIVAMPLGESCARTCSGPLYTMRGGSARGHRSGYRHGWRRSACR